MSEKSKNIKNIFEVLQDTNIQKQWKNIYELHTITKAYLLQAEEVCSDGTVFIQPLKEHRDAYDHIIRTFVSTYKEVPDSVDYVEYVAKNLEKAYAHEYRAFYDTADWLSYNLRRELRMRIECIPQKKRASVIKNYAEVAKMLNEYPFAVAECRNDKDITKEPAKNLVKDYCELLDKLIEKFKEIVA